MSRKRDNPQPEQPKPSRKQRKLSTEKTPEKAAKLGQAKGTNDAFCTECGEWYDSTNHAQFNKHAH